MIIDSHAHIDDRKYNGIRGELIERLKTEIDLMINVGSSVQSSKDSIDLASRHEFIYATVGIHPHNAIDFDELSLGLIRSMAREDKVVAIGEIGLDYHYDFSPRDVQREAFRAQIMLANELNLPIVIHDREAHSDVLDIVDEVNAGSRVLFHCFSGSLEMAREVIKRGHYISIAGPVTYSNAKKLVAVAENIPLNRMLVETDSPYLTPVPHRGKLNDPAKVVHTIERIAQIRELSFDEVAKATASNTLEFFGIKIYD